MRKLVVIMMILGTTGVHAAEARHYLDLVNTAQDSITALAVAPAALHAAAPPVSWAQPQIVTVVGHGLLAPDVASFRPDDPLTAQDLDTLVGGLTGQPVLATTSTSPVTITTLDARLVRAAGLTGAASQFQAGARQC